MKNLRRKRRLNTIGRLCLTKELRKKLDMKQGDLLNAVIEGDAICIKCINLKEGNKQSHFVTM